MTIAAKISPDELTAQVTNRFVGAYFEARLINAPGTAYIPGVTNDAAFLAFEVTPGTGGYQRSIISYGVGDVQAYSDDGVGLNQRAAVFAQDGSATTVDFSHVALVWSTGNAITVSTPSASPASGIDGTYTSIPVEVLSGSGSSMTVDLVVTNSGATLSDFALTVSKPGYGFAPGDSLQIANAELQSAGITAEVTGDLTFTVATVSTASNAGDILSVAQTASPVSVSGGNEVAFYFNLKQFGYNA